jgi:hypothetical protein
MYYESFWVAVSAAAPVIALAVVVAYADMTREVTLRMRGIDPFLGRRFPVWKAMSAKEDKPPHDARIAGRWYRTTVGLHRLNVLGQAAVLAFSLASLAYQANEMPPALGIAAEVGGLLAILGAGATGERLMDALYDVAFREAQERENPAT